jgi:DNA-binding NarL/FixJ family response regulator
VLSDKTVKNYVSSIVIPTLDLERRAQVAAFVGKHGRGRTMATRRE